MMRGATASAALAVLLAACGQSGDGGDNGVAATGGKAAASQQADGNLASLVDADQRFAALVRAAGMQKVLEGKEPYTLLVPTKEALDSLPPGTLERLQQPEARAELTGLLRQHILPGTILAADVTRAVEAGGGKARLASMAGDPLTITSENGALRIADESGAGARLVGSERLASNGVVHPIDGILSAPAAVRSGSD